MTNRNSLEEKRYTRRLSALMKGQIVAPNHNAPAPCVVRNISSKGAKLQLAKGWIIPRVFWLRLLGDPSLRFCTVIWRDGRDLGVSFAEDGEALLWPAERTNHSTARKSRSRLRQTTL